MFNCQKVSFNRYIATIVLLNGVLVHDIEEDISQTSNKDVGKLLRKSNKVVGPPCNYQHCLQVRMSASTSTQSLIIISILWFEKEQILLMSMESTQKFIKNW